MPIELSYVVQDARWTPRYNLRAKNSASPINLEYQADVFQNTGVDWDKVHLTLSTGNPQLGGSQPEIQPWKLYVQAPPPPAPKRRSKMDARTGSAPEMYDEVDEASADDDWGDYEGEEDEEPMEETTAFDFEDFKEVKTLADYTVVNEGATTAEFEISIKQDVPSGNKPQQVTVQSSELPSVYLYSWRF